MLFINSNINIQIFLISSYTRYTSFKQAKFILISWNCIFSNKLAVDEALSPTTSSSGLSSGLWKL